MSCSDPIADMLTVIRNGVRVTRDEVSFPHSKLKAGICQVLKDEGYIEGFDVLDTRPAKSIKVRLRYGGGGEQVIRTIQRVSKPGRRVHRRRRELHPVINGFGISIVSTSRGVLSDRACREANLGGEVLCVVK